MKIGLVAYDDCATSVVSGLVDTFALATVAAARLQPHRPTTFVTELVTPSGKPVTGSGGFVIRPTATLAALARCDVIAVPPIAMSTPEKLLDVVVRETELVAWLAKPRRGPAIICSVCTGAFLLAEAGLLDGKRATTNVWHGELLARRYPGVQVEIHERLIDEQSVISAGTTSAFLDLAIYLVDKFAGHDVAVWTAKALSKDKTIESQLPYLLFVGRRDHGDPDMLALQDWMQQRFADPVSAHQLARRAAMSERSLSRRFHDATGLSPMAYLRRLRIEAAKRLLETTPRKVTAICDDVGYRDARAFVRAFCTMAGVSPAAYRRRFHHRR